MVKGLVLYDYDGTLVDERDEILLSEMSRFLFAILTCFSYN